MIDTRPCKKRPQLLRVFGLCVAFLSTVACSEADDASSTAAAAEDDSELSSTAPNATAATTTASDDMAQSAADDALSENNSDSTTEVADAATADDSEADDSSTGGADDSDGCTAENQPTTTESGSEMCYSPFVRSHARHAQDFIGCECVECGGDMGVCMDGAHWFCVGRWVPHDVDTCDAPTACPLIWLQEFESVDEQECQAGDGLYQCNWRLSFSDYVRETKGFQDRSGEYRCEGMNVIGVFGPTEIVAPYDPDTGVLNWDGVAFQIQ